MLTWCTPPGDCGPCIPVLLVVWSWIDAFPDGIFARRGKEKDRNRLCVEKRDRQRASERREDQPPKLGARGKERPREEAPDGERLGEVYVARAAAALANGDGRRAEGMYGGRRTEGGARR